MKKVLPLAVHPALPLLHLGLALRFDRVLPVATMPLTLIVSDRYEIAREEAYLSRRFGSAYEEYRTRIRPWLQLRRRTGRVMLYYKGMQFVPMKGMAAMYYETDDEANVKRFMTVLEDVGETEKMEQPPMKKLFRPEMLEEVTAEEFERYWTA